jgi:hypothetical protein
MALAGYKQASSIAESVAAASPANAEWRILLARLDQKLGEYYALLAEKELQPAQRATDREEALRWYRKSVDLWNELQQRGALGPDTADKPVVVAREIANCAAAATVHP